MVNWIIGILAALFVLRQVRSVMGVRRLSVRALSERMAEDPGLQIVDVRSPAEYAVSHVPSSRCVPLGDLRARAGQWDPSRPLVLVCRSGHRAMQAYHILRRRGFKDLTVLAGGMVAWELQRSDRHSRREPQVPAGRPD